MAEENNEPLETEVKILLRYDNESLQVNILISNNISVSNKSENYQCNVYFLFFLG